MKTASIGDVSKLTGVSDKTLRYWEFKSYIQSPERMMSGSRALRRYSEEQIKLIIKLKSLIDQGFKLQIAANKLNEGVI